jgi:hypothetical protein
VHVKIAPTYEQVGSTLAGPYATPNSVASDTVFSSTGDIPSELTIQNGVIPDQCIEYTLSVSGVSGYTSVGGNSGLALFAGSTPAEADGLFTGVYHYDNSVSRGALADDLAESTTPYGPQKTVSSSYTVTVDVTDGVINTYLDGVHWQSYAPTAADIANWAGQTKFAAFHSGPGTLWQYAKASISNVKFYKPSKVATPTFSPAAGTYKRTKTVGISCTTSGATIRYTTDGSEPLPDSTQYTSALSVPGSCIIKAKAFKTGYKDSDTASATYTITRVWTQTGSTIAGPYWTPDAMGGGFSSTIDMPSAVTIQGGAIPDMKVEYTLTVDGVTGWGYQPNGNSGLAMYLSSTPSSTDGAFTGVCHPDYWTSRGAIVGNIAAMPDPAPYTTPYTVSSSYTVSAEIVGGVATTTITGVNCRYYSVTSTDVSNWSGQTKFAAFHCNPWSTTDYGRAGISNIKFYTGETAVTWVQIGNTITTQYATGDPPIPNGYTTTAFSSVGDMPSELAVSGGVAPDFKVTYDLKLLWSWWYGAQYGGNSGFALYQNSTPSTSGGLYGGMNGNYSGGWYSTGAFTGNVSNASGGTGSYTLTPTDPALTLAVTEQKVGSTVTTTITGQDSRDYTVTSTDISNWTGKSKFAAFRGPTGQNWNCGAVGVTNITFYKGE